MAEYRGSPNILLLLTDQERYDLTGLRNEEYSLHSQVETPNLDKFQNEGMSFDNSYTPVGICTSARASLMSGQYPHNHGMLNNCHGPDALQENLPDGLTTFSEILDENGYTNTYAGKWHVGKDQGPEDFGFEFVGGGDSQLNPEDPEFEEYLREEFDVDLDDTDLEDLCTEKIYTENDILMAAKYPLPEEATLAHYLADKTIEQLEEFAENDETFFHRIDFPGPHHPYVPPDNEKYEYDPEDIEPWPNFDDDYKDKPHIQEEYLENRGVADMDWDDWSEVVAKYFGFVTFLDHEMGRIFDKMEELGLNENTAVFKTADHGDMTGAHGQFNKGPMMYQENYKIPLIVRWPDVTEPGSTSDKPVGLHDLMPTFVEMAGEEPPKNIDGRSLVPILEAEEPEDWRDTIVSEYHGDEFGLYTQRMATDGNHKLILNHGGVNELYDLENDPHELENLIDDPEHQDVREDLFEDMKKWMEKTDDSWGKWNTWKIERKLEEE